MKDLMRYEMVEKNVSRDKKRVHCTYEQSLKINHLTLQKKIPYMRPVRKKQYACPLRFLKTIRSSAVLVGFFTQTSFLLLTFSVPK